LSTMRTKLAFLAFEQMASKGVVAMEEVRRQLSEQIPGAAGIMADALGITLKELNEWIKTGKLASEYVLPLMAHQMRGENRKAVEALGKSFKKSLGDMETAWFKLKVAMAEPEGIVSKTVTWGLDTTAFQLENVQRQLGLAKKQLVKFRDFLNDLGTDNKSNGIYYFKKVNEVIKEVNDNLKLSEKEREEYRKGARDSVFGGNLKDLEDWRDSVNSVFSDVGQEFTSFVADLANGVDVSFSAMLASMATHILNFTTHMLLIKPILDWLRATLVDISAPGATDPMSLFGKLLGSYGMPFVAPPPTPKANAFAEGGMINEPVIGIGAKSHSGYLIGEAGPEAVVPKDKLGGGSATNVTVNISAVDSKSLTELLKNNPQAITGPIVAALSGGDRGLSSSIRMAVA
ncbi:MAG: tape measure protein, partial [Candidatus Peribacteraceae bacterium]|nr:tape measure protein [Candidatus Peribacteraceae bacterium]